MSEPVRRLAITLVVAAATVAVSYVPMPGLELDFPELKRRDLDALGVFAFGLNPFIWAALLVEALAALVPRWRHLRHSGIEGRSRLHARTKLLTFALASVQAFFMFRWMDSTENLGYGPMLPDAAGARLVIAAGPVLGSMVMVWLAGLISRHGLGNGFSVLIAAFQLPDIAWNLAASVDEQLAGGNRVLAPIAFSVLVVAAAAVSTARNPRRGWDQQPPQPELLTPASGLVPLTWAYGLLHLSSYVPGLATVTASLRPGTALDAAVHLPITVGLCFLLGWLFNRPGAVAAIWRRDPRFGTDPALVRACARSALLRGWGRAVLLLAALTLMGWFVDHEQVEIDVLGLLVIACVTADVVAELRFRRCHGPLAAPWPLHRMYAVGMALGTLARAGIAAFPRGLRHGTLLNFWGPYVPVEIFVPESRGPEAQALICDQTAIRPPPD